MRISLCRSVIVPMCLVAGCSAASGPPALSPSAIPTPLANQVPSPAPECDAASAPYELLDARFHLFGGDWVALSQCGGNFIQRVGRSPDPLSPLADGLTLRWLSPDASSAIGTRQEPADTGLHVQQAPAHTVTRLVKRTVGGTETVLPMEAQSGVVSPDGRSMAYWVPRTADSGKVTFGLGWLDLETRERVLVTEVDNALGLPVWSPDSRKLLVAASFGPTYQMLGVVEKGRLTVFQGDYQTHYDPMYAAYGWSADSSRVFVYEDNPKTTDPHVSFLTLDTAGNLLAERPIVDDAGQPVPWFYPREMKAGSSLVVGDSGVLDVETATLHRLPTDSVYLGWASAPGKLLRWRALPGGPVLDTVAAP